MCGIIGIISDKPVAPMILEGLKRLEYRGYDSAGIATIAQDGTIDRRRAPGKLVHLADTLDQSPLSGFTGIGHTRWATHGAPTIENAHPHFSSSVGVVHNGIIENFAEIKAELLGQGVTFTTQTDTEVIAHLIQRHLDQCGDPVEASERTLKRLEGAFALGIIFQGEEQLMIGARRGCPLALGYGEMRTDGGSQEMFLGSDAFALSSWTRSICYLEEGDWVVVRPGEAVIRDENGQLVNREVRTSQVSADLITKGSYRHFMEKEIFEQPTVMAETLQSHLNPATQTVTFNDLALDFSAIRRLTIIACGTSYYAGLTAKYWFEQIARLPVECDIASEYRYREAPIGQGEAALFISQSGETSDTLAALRYCKGNGAKIISVVNVPESTIARESDMVLQTLAGPEIGVASTKAMTTQMMLLASLSIHAGVVRGTVDPVRAKDLTQQLVKLPSTIQSVLKDITPYQALGARIAEARDILFLGRGSLFPIAMEGALKLKEISYIHAEGYAAGEMKHGPIALIDDAVPIVVACPSGRLFEKTASNCEEAGARGGRMIILTDQLGANAFQGKAESVTLLPEIDEFTAPILYVVPMQLIAYHTAVAKGTDVDQPRNLAKSVTVE